MGPKPNDKCLSKRQKRRAQRQGKAMWKIKASIRVLQMQVKDLQEPSETERSKEGFSPRAFGRDTDLLTLDFRLLTAQLGKEYISDIFKPPG